MMNPARTDWILFTMICEKVWSSLFSRSLFNFICFSRSHVGCKRKIRHISVLSSTLVWVPDELSVTTNEILTEYFDTKEVHCACRGLYISTWITVIRRICTPGHPGSALNRRGVQGSPGNEGSVTDATISDILQQLKFPNSGGLIATDLRYTSSLFGSSEWSGQLSVILWPQRTRATVQACNEGWAWLCVGPRELKCLFVIW